MLDVTVIIPFYNRISFLENALKSVSNQSIIPKRVIVIDDYSIHSDSLNQLSELDFPFEFSIFRNDINSGVSASRNLGLLQSNTKYVAFLDEDDSWHPDKLEFQFNLMEEQNISISSTSHSNHLVDSMDLSLGQVYIKKLNFWTVLTRNVVNTSSVMMRIDIYRNYTFNLSLRYTQDYELWLKILKHHSIYLINKPLTIRKEDYNHKGLSSNLLKMYKDEIRTINEVLESNVLKWLVSIFITIKLIRRYLRRLVAKLRIQ